MVESQLNHLKGFVHGMDKYGPEGNLIARWNGSFTASIVEHFATGTSLVRILAPGEGFTVIDDDVSPKQAIHHEPDPRCDFKTHPLFQIAGGGWVVPT